MNSSDIKALRVPLIALALAILIAAAGAYYTDQLTEQARKTLTQRQTELRQARQQLQQSGDEKRTIETFLGDYQKLVGGGFVGDEQRINWLDGLRVANQRADLFGVTYEIGAQGRYPYAAELNPGQLALNHSIMKLRFNLLHEEDLMRFFDVLAQAGVGVFSINACSMRRIDTGGVIRVEPHIATECELSWITAKAPPRAAAPARSGP